MAYLQLYEKSQNLTQSDLNKPTNISNSSYDIVTCVGTFTFAHVKAHALDEFVRITVYDMLGNFVSNLVYGYETYGFKTVKWNATNNKGEPVSAGVYLYCIEAGEFRQTKKMILLK